MWKRESPDVLKWSNVPDVVVRVAAPLLTGVLGLAVYQLLIGEDVGLIGLLVFVGGLYLLKRECLRIDRRAGTVELWWELILPVRRRQFALARFDRVRVRARSSEEGGSWYKLSLCGDACATFTWQAGRRSALRVARPVAEFAGLVLEELDEQGAMVREGPR